MNEMSQVVIDKLIELNELEIMKSKVFAALFQKSTNEIVEYKIKIMKSNFEKQANYYGQSVDNYEDEYQDIAVRYREQLFQILRKYDEYFINMCLELQEAECNQKIVIANLKNSYEIKEQIKDRAKEEIIEEYERKLYACLEKKKNYDFIIYKYEKSLNECLNEIQKLIDEVFSEKDNMISLKNESRFEKVISKIRNLFTGKANFKLYVLQPINIELDSIDEKLLGITNNIHQETINFVARSKRAKDEINVIFENMI